MPIRVLITVIIKTFTYKDILDVYTHKNAFRDAHHSSLVFAIACTVFSPHSLAPENAKEVLGLR